MVVNQSQAPSHISRSHRRPISQSQNSVNALTAIPNLFQNRISRRLRRLKMHRDRPIPPRIIQLVTPVRNKPQLHAKFPRGRIKAPRLIPQFPRKHQHPFHFHHFFANDCGSSIQAPPFFGVRILWDLREATGGWSSAEDEYCT